MISRRDEVNNPVGATSIPLQPLIDNILLFIDKYLPQFPTSLVKSKIVGEKEVEKLLNQQLIDFFNGHSPDFNQYLIYRFVFRKDDENKGTNYKPDIGVTIWNKDQSFSEVKSFFQIECKRLPTPNISSSRGEKEYVIGIEENTGGIERFKNNKHGSHLEEAAIIGFIQEDALEVWHNRITEWVGFEIAKTNSTWKMQDHLVLSYKDAKLHKYNSTCHREKGLPIKLHHFLLNLVVE
jgi:hypothetical protein